MYYLSKKAGIDKDTSCRRSVAWVWVGGQLQWHCKALPSCLQSPSHPRASFVREFDAIRWKTWMSIKQKQCFEFWGRFKATRWLQVCYVVLQLSSIWLVLCYSKLIKSHFPQWWLWLRCDRRDNSSRFTPPLMVNLSHRHVNLASVRFKSLTVVCFCIVSDKPVDQSESCLNIVLWFIGLYSSRVHACLKLGLISACRGWRQVDYKYMTRTRCRKLCLSRRRLNRLREPINRGLFHTRLDRFTLEPYSFHSGTRELHFLTCSHLRIFTFII